VFYLNVFFGDTIISNDTLFEVMSGNFYSYSRQLNILTYQTTDLGVYNLVRSSLIAGLQTFT